jgi:Spy/CpxP family protein refolding chaperone
MRSIPVRAARSAAIAIVAAAGLATAASARPGPGMGGHHGFFLEKAVAKLELPAETQTAVQAVIDQAKPAGDKLREDVKSAHEGMRALLERDTVDESAVMAQADAVGAAMTEKRKHELRTLLQVRALLTPEQRTQLEQMMQERKDRRGLWRLRRDKESDAR